MYVCILLAYLRKFSEYYPVIPSASFSSYSSLQCSNASPEDEQEGP